MAARASLEEIPAVLAPTRAQRAQGLPLSLIALDLADRASAGRRETAKAFADYERAVGSLRASMVRALVDEEGASFSALARRMGISRQAVTRLYEAGSRDKRP